MKLSDRLKMLGVALGTTGSAQVDEDAFTLTADADGLIRQPCWFCNTTIEYDPQAQTGAVSLLFTEVLGGGGHAHGLCHTTCAARSKGSLDR